MQALDQILQGDADLIDTMREYYQFYNAYQDEKGDKKLSELVIACRPHAEKGNPFAQFVLGFLTYNGLGTTRDLVGAINWYQAAAAQKNPYGFYGLGEIHHDNKNFELAKTYFQMAGDAGDLRGYQRLGWLYSNGAFGFKDLVEAKKWIKLAADKGYSFSCYQS